MSLTLVVVGYLILGIGFVWLGFSFDVWTDEMAEHPIWIGSLVLLWGLVAVGLILYGCVIGLGKLVLALSRTRAKDPDSTRPPEGA